jgi:TnpA family transposase
MPRIRNWKGLKLFRPSKTSRYKHIDMLFTDVIDWSLIETHVPDMLRVVLSIRSLQGSSRPWHWAGPSVSWAARTRPSTCGIA